jgi:squalene synthase HpnD
MSQQDQHDYVARQVRAAGSSFYWAMRLQNPDHRRALFAIYAYCRALDDIADGPMSRDQKRAALKVWRDTVTSAYSAPDLEPQRVDEPLVWALKDTITRHALPREPFLALIRGMETDVEAQVIAPTWPELLAYCDDVAGAVGELCLATWGWRGGEATSFAQTTGRALQLTNILRDVWDDAAHGRLYLPQEALSDAGVDVTAPGTVVRHANLHLACEIVADTAAEFYTSVNKNWPQPLPRELRAARVMVNVYQKLFRKIRARGWSEPKRISLSPFAKMTTALATVLSRP